MHVVDWQRLFEGRRLPSGDWIHAEVKRLEYAAGDARQGFVRIVLVAGPGLSRWRGIELLSWENAQLSFASTQSCGERVEAQALAGSEEGARRAVLWRADAFGIHVPVYALVEADRFRGCLVTMTWLEDG